MAHPEKKLRNIGINISVSKRTLEGAYKIMKMILEDKNSDQSTKQAALTATVQMTSVHSTSIANNMITFDKQLDK